MTLRRSGGTVLLGLLVAALSLACLSAAPSARADVLPDGYEPGGYFHDSQFDADLLSYGRGVDGTYNGVTRGVQLDAKLYQGSATVPAAYVDARGALWRARIAAGFLPKLSSAITTLTLGTAAFQLGWKIGRTIDTKWLHLTGSIGTFTGTYTKLTGARW